MSITSTAWAVVAASVSASVFSFAGAFWLDAKHAKRQAQIAKGVELKSACARIISGALRVSHKSSALGITMVTRSGLSEGLSVLLRIRRAVDPLELNDYLFSELAPILDAQSVVWLSEGSDAALIRSAGDVVLAVADVIEKSTALPKDRQLDPKASRLDQVLLVLRGLTPLKLTSEDEAARQASVKRLGLACARFGELMREKLAMEDIGAILKAFPNLLEPENVRSGTAE
jgi:hypothetical protein